MTTKARYPESPKITRVPSSHTSRAHLPKTLKPKNPKTFSKMSSLANAPPFASEAHLPKTLKPKNPKTFSR